MAQIQRLSSDVAAQIKASANLSSLNDVVIGLLENALDARSERINIKVDFARASCWIHDDGIGLHPSNFADTGGLGKAFHTSNVPNESDSLGSKGLFLSSVAAVAVLTITSRYHGLNEASALILHFSRPATRLLPAPEHMTVELQDHGTKISVHDLFGNMPVRVKQRLDTEEDRGARNREWTNLCIAVTGCMLAYGKPLHVSMKGGDENHVFNVKNIKTIRRECTPSHGINSRVDLAKSILQQAFHLTNPTIWVPISARTNSVTVQAIIGAEPSPQKHLQFVGIGNRYMPPNGSCEMLYVSINQIFQNSSFGSIDGGVSDHDNMKGRLNGSRQNLKHWPIFVVLINYNKLDNAYGQDFVAKLDGIVTAIATRFLTEHHHRPRAPYKTRTNSSKSRQTLTCDTLQPIVETAAAITVNTEGTIQKPFLISDGLFTELGFDVRLPTDQLKKPVIIHKDDTAFRSQFIPSHTADKLTKRINTAELIALSKKPAFETRVLKSTMETDPPPDKPRQDGAEVISCAESTTNNNGHTPHTQSTPHEDEYINWTDPNTQKTFCVNTRTGFIVKPKESQRPVTTDDSRSEAALLRTTRNPLSRLLRSADGIVPPADDSWVKNFLQSWQNPVFENAQTRLPTAIHDSYGIDETTPCGGSSSSVTDISQDIIVQTPLRLSKADLGKAVVISQVDSKFILIKINDSLSEFIRSLVILVDQHAADERVKVEKLLEDLCSSPDRDLLDYTSPLNQKSAIATIILQEPISIQIQHQERELFHGAAPYFARWGILYDINASTDSYKPHRLVVLSLPPSIAQRCKQEPRLLFNLLQSEARKQEEASYIPAQAHIPYRADSDWTIRIRDCPTGILDLINSRACRSAIMFNDFLTLDQCRNLISDLSKCQFPFQCAHGRPSMVPLLSLGEDTKASNVPKQGNRFADAWKRWTEEC